MIKLQKQLKVFYERKSVRCQKKKQKLRSHSSKQRCGHPQRSVPTLWVLLQMRWEVTARVRVKNVMLSLVSSLYEESIKMIGQLNHFKTHHSLVESQISLMGKDWKLAIPAFKFQVWDTHFIEYPKKNQNIIVHKYKI